MEFYYMQHRTFSRDVLFSLRFSLAPFGMLLLGKILFELLAFRFPELNQSLIQSFSEIKEQPLSLSFQEAKARILWLTSVILYFFVCSAFIAFIWNTLKRSLTKSSIAVLISAVMIYSVSEIAYLSQAAVNERPLVTIFRFTFDSLQASKQYSLNELSRISFTLSIVNFVAIIIVPLGIVTGCCIMQGCIPHHKVGLESLLKKSKYIKELLVGGSAVMVIGILHMQLWLNWPVTFVVDDDVRQQIEAVTLAICQYWGVIYTLTMAALYIPSAFSLSEQARELINLENSTTDKVNSEIWLAENKMLLSINGQLPQLLAVIAPMLAGTLGSTFSGVTFV